MAAAPRTHRAKATVFPNVYMFDELDDGLGSQDDEQHTTGVVAPAPTPPQPTPPPPEPEVDWDIKA
ncbi:hypothetical protein DXG01_011995, partial [Tephrocybe rancida]